MNRGCMGVFPGIKLCRSLPLPVATLRLDIT
jgi:hypothetical protein